MTDEPDYPGDGAGPEPLFDAGPAGPTAVVTRTQDEIMAFASKHGSVSPLQAGIILHAARGHCGAGAKGGKGDGAGCCPYASSDGLESIKRLMRRRRLIRTAKGVYRAASAPQITAVDVREEAIDRAERGAHTEWRDRAIATLVQMAATSRDREFICDDLRAAMGNDEPREPRAYGAILRRARAEGICTPLAYWRVSTRVSNHARPERVWRFS